MKFFTMKKVFLFLMIGLVCTIVMTSCGEDNEGPGNVSLTDIKIEPESVRVDVRNGQVAYNVKVSPVPANATDVDFKWETKDASVATAVESELGVGTITVLKDGSTVVTVRSGQVSKDIPVEGYIDIRLLTDILLTVVNTEPVSESPLTVAVPVGETVRVIATPEPVNANTATENAVVFEWTSDNENVAMVDQSGNITVTGKGKAKITVSCAAYEDITAEIVIEGV
jgi:uncharacterized protein YjdB